MPGVREYLLAHNKNQRFVLVTATPQEEIEQILQVLDIIHCFYEVHGASTCNPAKSPPVETKRPHIIRPQLYYDSVY